LGLSAKHGTAQRPLHADIYSARLLQEVYFILRIIDDKVWIEENRTERDIGVELMERGIPRDDLVLGLHSPRKRQYTDCAAA